MLLCVCWLDAAKQMNTKKKEKHKSSATEVVGDENRGGRGQQTGRRTIAKRRM